MEHQANLYTRLDGHSTFRRPANMYKNDITLTHHPRIITRKKCLFSKATCRTLPHDYALDHSLASWLAGRYAKVAAHVSRSMLCRTQFCLDHFAVVTRGVHLQLILALRMRTTSLLFRSKLASRTRVHAHTTPLPPPQMYPAPTHRKMMNDGKRAMIMAIIQHNNNNNE